MKVYIEESKMNGKKGLLLLISAESSEVLKRGKSITSLVEFIVLNKLEVVKKEDV